MKLSMAWTEDDIETLATCIEEGKKPDEVIEILGNGRTISSVRAKARKLGLKWKNDFKPWKKEERAELERLIEKGMTPQQISEVLNRPVDGVKARARNSNIKWRCPGRQWSDEDDKLLQSMWSDPTMSVMTIAKKLNRSKDSINHRALILYLGARPYDDQYLTVNDICNEMQVNDSVVRRWFKGGLKTKRCKSGKFSRLVDSDDLLKFLEKHQNRFNASKISNYIFAEEPEWLINKRKEDIKSSTIKPTHTRWTEEDLDKAIRMFKRGKSNQEIGNELGRTEFAVMIKLREHNLSRRIWNKYELEILKANMHLTAQEIAKKLPLRSTKAVKIKIGRLLEEERKR